MGKPFRTDGGGSPLTDIGRGAGGRFVRTVPPAPPQVVRRSAEQGESVDSVVADVRQPDHEQVQPFAPVKAPAKGPFRVG